MHLPDNSLLQGGKYKIVRFISSGGFGCTYEAEHIMLHKRVAIKEFFVKDFCNRDETSSQISVGITSKTALVDKLKRKFIEEAQSLCALDHPNIVHVFDVFEENGTAYYVMDYIDGPSLNELVKKEGPMSEPKALGYIKQVADALKYVHSRNRLHLDIKPGNIMVDEKDKAILIDFGASKQYDEEAGENTSTLLGKTPGYAPLEQMGNDVVKFMPSTDIYALGATLYKLLTGITPPSASLLASGETLAEMPTSVSAGTRKAVSQSMQIYKMKRPQSIDEFLQVLSSDSVCDESTIFDDSGNGSFTSHRNNQNDDESTHVFKPAWQEEEERRKKAQAEEERKEIEEEESHKREQNLAQKKNSPKALYVVLSIIAVIIVIVYFANNNSGTLCNTCGESISICTYNGKHPNIPNSSREENPDVSRSRHKHVSLKDNSKTPFYGTMAGFPFVLRLTKDSNGKISGWFKNIRYTTESSVYGEYRDDVLQLFMDTQGKQNFFTLTQNEDGRLVGSYHSSKVLDVELSMVDEIVLKGKIGSIPIHMMLWKNKSSVTGIYYYDRDSDKKQSNYMILQGTYSSGSFNLKESNLKGTEQGTFVFSTAGDSYSGSFESVSGSQSDLYLSVSSTY